MNRGRPSVKLQIDIQNKIEDCFFHGYSARKTSKLLDIDKKTAQNYFKKISSIYKNIVQSDSNFENRVQESRVDTAISLENRFDELLSLSDKYHTKLDNLDLTDETFKIYKFLSNEIIRINSDLVNIQVLKTNFALTPSTSEFAAIQGDALSN